MPARPADQKVKILYIEDNRENRMLVRAVLEAAGYLIVDAEDGLAGIEAAIREEPALILLDINLPDMDGYAVMQCLRESELTRHIPVVAISANAMPKDIERGKAAGFVAYVTKPIDIVDLQRRVRDLLALQQAGGSPPDD